ncbi:MAG: hypothetical protein JOZ57_02845 [Abitibacteriaceae bacterium]|nr:hypothetical protein [Abditibacteriaceae bacterium]
MKRRKFLQISAGLTGAAVANGYLQPLAVAQPEATPRPALTPKLETPRTTLTGHGGPVTSLAYSPDGQFLVSSAALLDARRAHIGGEVFVWDARTNALLVKLIEDAEAHLLFTPDGGTLVCAAMHWRDGAGTPDMQLWDSHGEPKQWQFRRSLKEANAAGATAVSRDGKWLATSGRDDGTDGLLLWDLAARDLNADLKDQLGFVASIDFSPDGKQLLAVFWTTGANKKIASVVEVYDVATLRLLHTNNLKQMVTNLNFMPGDTDTVVGSRWLANEVQGSVQLWDVASGEVRQTLDGPDTIFGLEFSPDRKHLAVACHRRHLGVTVNPPYAVEIYNVADWTLHQVIAAGRTVPEAMAYAPDGRTLATGGANHTVHLWAVT